MRWCKAPSNNEMPLTIEIPRRVFKDFIFFAKRYVYYKFPTKRNQKPPNQMFSHQQPSNSAIFSNRLPLFLKDQFLEKRLLIFHV